MLPVSYLISPLPFPFILKRFRNKWFLPFIRTFVIMTPTAEKILSIPPQISSERVKGEKEFLVKYRVKFMKPSNPVECPKSQGLR